MQKITKQFLLDTCDALLTEPTPPARGMFYNNQSGCSCFMGHVLRRAGFIPDIVNGGLNSPNGRYNFKHLSDVLDTLPDERHKLYQINDDLGLDESWPELIPRLRAFIETMEDF